MTIAETRTFEFYVATIERENQSLGRGDLWVIDRQQKQAASMIEVLEGEIELELVKIPGGSFLMGSPRHEHRNANSHHFESPQHTVTIRPFCLGKYPVTQAQWRAVASLPQVKCDLDLDPSTFKGDSLPVEGVTWYDAVEFCQRLTQYSQRPYRLPTEAEWEYACRAGTTTAFHFGERLRPALANFRPKYPYSDGGSTTPVGSFGVANAFGLYDMHGNVLEWCLDDWHGDYEGAPTDGSAWFDSDNTNPSRKPYRAVLQNGTPFVYPVDCPSAYRPLYPNPGEEEWWDMAMLRGGSWRCYSAFCRSGERIVGDTANRVTQMDDIGFRVVCSFEAKTT